MKSIKQIIREEITSSDRCVDNIIDREHTGSCTVFDGKLKTLCRRLETMKYKLSDPSGLNMDQIIRKQLDPHKENIPSTQMEKFVYGLKLLYATKKYSRDYIIGIKEKLDNSKLVYTDGEWHFVNKLNTNYSDLSELLTCYINDKHPEQLPILLGLFKNEDEKSVIDLLKPIVNEIGDHFNIDDLKTFTRNTTINTKIGEDAERDVLELLKENGLRIDYEGGNGDFLDMMFGVDIIANMKLIQVKSSIRGVSRIRPEIDWVAVSNSYQGIGIYDRMGRIITHNGVKLCKGKLCDMNVRS